MFNVSFVETPAEAMHYQKVQTIFIPSSVIFDCPVHLTGGSNVESRSEN